MHRPHRSILISQRLYSKLYITDRIFNYKSAIFRFAICRKYNAINDAYIAVAKSIGSYGRAHWKIAPDYRVIYRAAFEATHGGEQEESKHYIASFIISHEIVMRQNCDARRKRSTF